MWVRWLLVAALALVACNRRIEPFVPGEKPQAPDLSRIFPEGAERAAARAAGMPAAPGPRGAPPMASASGSAQPIEGRVRLAQELSARVRDGAVLFLIARTGAGGPPLAVKRIEHPVFPLEFRLGPEDRMIKSRPFVGPLRITARLDADGNATTRGAGDYEGSAPESVEPGASGVDVVIDRAL